jgi:hypothetical protein
MINILPKSPIQSENTITDCKTPPLIQQNDQIYQNPGNDLRKPTTPERLKVPKAFKYPERYFFLVFHIHFMFSIAICNIFLVLYFFGRYRSPTDSMMSPVTKGLLARSRKGAMLLPPSINQTKVLNSMKLFFYTILI